MINLILNSQAIDSSRTLINAVLDFASYLKVHNHINHYRATDKEWKLIKENPHITTKHSADFLQIVEAFTYVSKRKQDALRQANKNGCPPSVWIQTLQKAYGEAWSHNHSKRVDSSHDLAASVYNIALELRQRFGLAGPQKESEVEDAATICGSLSRAEAKVACAIAFDLSAREESKLARLMDQKPAYPTLRGMVYEALRAKRQKQKEHSAPKGKAVAMVPALPRAPKSDKQYRFTLRMFGRTIEGEWQRYDLGSIMEDCRVFLENGVEFAVSLRP